MHGSIDVRAVFSVNLPDQVRPRTRSSHADFESTAFSRMMLEELESNASYHSPLIGESLPKIFLRDNRVEDLRKGGNSSISDDFRVWKALSQFNHGRISPIFLVQGTQTFIERCLGSLGPSGSLLMNIMFRMLETD